MGDCVHCGKEDASHVIVMFGTVHVRVCEKCKDELMNEQKTQEREDST